MTPDEIRGDGGSPLIVTAELPDDLQAWADRLRRLHYPAERNRVPAHVTLFHALPPSCEAELRGRLAAAARDNPPPPARLEGVMPLGNGTALRLASPVLLALRTELAGQFHGLLSPQNQPEPRLHVTVQNKVAAKAAKALQAELERAIQPREFRFAGLALQRYRDGPWEPLQSWSFRG